MKNYFKCNQFNYSFRSLVGTYNRVQQKKGFRSANARRNYQRFQ